MVLLLCSIPVITMPIIQSGLGEGSKENRDMQEFPGVLVEGKINTNFFNEFDLYLQDHFNFRSELIALNTKIYEEVFTVSSEEQVIVGKDHWLFFQKTLDDYRGDGVLSTEEIDQIVYTISLINDYVSSQGSEFRFVIAPNKNSVYPEYMPSNYLGKNETSNMNLLSEKLSSDYYVDVFPVLSEEDEITYLSRDSHWNNMGAYLAFEEIMDSLNLEMNFSISDYEIREDFKGDLDDMLYPTGGKLIEQYYYTFDTEYEYTSRFKTLDDIRITTESATGEGKALVYRDSFGEALIEYFARQFATLEYSRVVPYDFSNAKDYDYIILEIVERNLANLLEITPVIEELVQSEGL